MQAMPLPVFNHNHNNNRARRVYSSSRLVSRSQTHYALANLLDGALAVKGLGTYAWPARAGGMQLNE